MKSLFNPRWLLLINTLPIIVLLFIFYSDFQIINSLLSEESIGAWKFFGLTLILLGLGNLIYVVYLIVKNQKLTYAYGIIALVTYITFIYLFFQDSSLLIPNSIPRWMLSGDLELYVSTFLMPTLAYSFFILTNYLTPPNKEYKMWKNFSTAAAIPILLYLFIDVIVPLFEKPLNHYLNRHLVSVFAISMVLVFLFFLIRTLLLFLRKRNVINQEYLILWKIIISLILPLIGLALNNGHINFLGMDGGYSIFGGFGNSWFYILAILNGLFICLPQLKNVRYRLTLFVFRCITLTYTFYFFMVFLPYLPLSIFAIVAFGLGFLMLVPLVLMLLHRKIIIEDFKFLNSFFSKITLRTYLILGLLVIPVYITISNFNDRNTLHQTLEYVYTPDYSKSYKHINKQSLKETLDVVRGHKDKARFDVSKRPKPFLSAFFNWMVLDNLTLSDTKIRQIESIFFSESKTTKQARDFNSTEEVKISNLNTKSSYDASQNCWKSWIEFELTNYSTTQVQSEYLTSFELPVGTWISDYYLYVGDRREMGILSEKKSAMWVYSSIRNYRRDPGILYYLTGNKMAFRVFPFAQNEVRNTGFELIHKEPIELTIDGRQIILGEHKANQNTVFENENAIYVSSVKKQNLKKVNRTPYFHFLVDATDDGQSSNYSERIDSFAMRYPNLSKNAKISFVNSYTSTQSLDENWKQNYQNQEFEGGFYIDRVIKSVLFDAYKNQGDRFPVIVCVSSDLKKAIFETDFADWAFSFPESELFYNLNKYGNLESHSLLSMPSKPIDKPIDFSFNFPVLEYNLKDNTTQYLADNQKSSILLKHINFQEKDEHPEEKNWNSGLTMQAKWRAQTVYPETTDEAWLDLMKHSFRTKIMSPVSAYLVVENEAQKAILKKKQEQILLSKKSLDLGEDSLSMSEPNVFLLLILLALVIFVRKKFY